MPHDATLMAFVQDLRQRVHALLAYGSAWGPAGYLYLTDATGKWTTSRVTPLSSWSVLITAHLAADPVTGSIVIVTSEWIAPSGPGRPTHWAIRIGRKARTSTAFGRLTTLLTPGRKFGPMPTGVLSVGGRIVIAARVLAAPDSVPATNGLYLLVGTRPSAMGAWRHIAGSMRDDANLVIGMPMQTVIDLAWTHFSPSWVPSSQGVFMSTYRYGASTHRWVFTKPQQRSNCNYDDRTIAIARDVKGHAFLGFVRQGGP